MLQDPDNPYSEWEETIRAVSLTAAQSKCELIASQFLLTEVINVTQTTITPTKNGTYKFICWFRTEIITDDSNNKTDN
ncbi:hypothetical protein [Nostoc sp. TCL26-01]|uniref:hypothetical protein n=1 Tax=Nostoc sp. TCL26-01 TaxID=2576904 RepID=UPI0015BFF128|nr:hypothetical protein [Nostoc sp. TCL26-01]QLE56782.1 hypothetical protein FD725_15465 [Nostoc sp. TCL26-01]